MSDTYTEIYYHFIWTTKNREAMITADMEAVLYTSIKAICRDLKVTIHALNGLPDHVHLACTLPTIVAPAPLMNKVKGISAHLVNHLPEGRHSFAWQPGYGALTFARRDLKTIVSYIQNQQQHHQGGKLSEKMERTATERPGLERPR
jgi:putative transposase